MNQPLASIIIPTYNYGHYVMDAINSALASDYSPKEIIVVNDGSTDGLTDKVLASIDHHKVKVFTIPNGGVAAARNFAISKAKGKYILSLDADNIVLPDYLPKAIEILEAESNIDIVYADYQLFGSSNEVHHQGELNYVKILYHNHIDNCAVFRKVAFDRTIVGYEMEAKLNTHEDWMFWLRMLVTGSTFYYLPEVLWKYRNEHEGKLTRLGRDQTRIARVYTHVYPLQKELLSKFLKEGKINSSQAHELRAILSHRLAYYQLNFLDYFKGLGLAIRSSLLSKRFLGKNLRTIAGASYRRLAGKKPSH
jgi:glycosyltransferase involved in cell wall biosynthesis